MNDDNRSLWLSVSAAAIALILYYGVNYLSCGSISKKMGLNHDYGLFYGCMIEYEKGKWIQSSKYRAFD